MKKLEKIKEQILTIIQKEESKTRSELEELSRKQQDNMDFYGIGGPYQRYEHAIERRRNHLSELEALRKITSFRSCFRISAAVRILLPFLQ